MAENLVNSVKKALGILDILIFESYGSKGVGLFDLSRQTDIKPNTLHNLLKTMVACGYVQQNEDSKYLAGPKCAGIGIMNRLAPGSPVLTRIEEELKELSKRIDESVIFAILADGSRLPLLRIDHDSPVKVDFSVLEDEHIYNKDTGRILAAYADEYALERIIEKHGLPREKWGGIKDSDAFKKALGGVRDKGCSVTLLSEREVVSMAVPVLFKGGRLIGSLGSYAPIYRCDAEKQREIVSQMKVLAEKLEELV